MRYFSSDGERIGSDPSKLLEEQLLFLLREALQQALIEDSGSIRQGMGDFLSLSSHMQPDETIIGRLLTAFCGSL